MLPARGEWRDSDQPCTRVLGTPSQSIERGGGQPVARRRRGKPLRYVWLSLGMVCLSFGAAGAVLPLLPATPFLLLATWAFARSSDRFHGWLVEHPTLGPPIHAWKTKRAISRRTKLVAMASLAAGLAVSLAAGVSWTVLAFQLAALGAVAAFILTRRET